MKNVIFISDFSDDSRYSLKNLINLVQSFKGNLYIIYVLRNEVESTTNFTAKLKEYTDPFKNQGVKILSLFIRTNLIHAIQRLQSKNKDDLIVMKFNDTYIKDQIMPKRPEDILELSTAPVLMMHGKNNINCFSNFILAFDHISQVFLPNLDAVRIIAESFNSKVHFLNIADVTEVDFNIALQKMEVLAQKHKLNNYAIHTVLNENFYDGINYFIEKKNLKSSILTYFSPDKYQINDFVEEVDGKVMMFIE